MALFLDKTWHEFLVSSVYLLSRKVWWAHWISRSFYKIQALFRSEETTQKLILNIFKYKSMPQTDGVQKIDRSIVKFPWFLAVHILCRFVWISIRNKSNSSFSMIIDFNLNQSSYVVHCKSSIHTMGYRLSLKTRMFPVQILLMFCARIREATS